MMAAWARSDIVTGAFDMADKSFRRSAGPSTLPGRFAFRLAAWKQRFEPLDLERKLGLIRLQLVELVFELVFAVFVARAELVQSFANAPSHACVGLALETARESRAPFCIAHLDERAHDVDPKMR